MELKRIIQLWFIVTCWTSIRICKTDTPPFLPKDDTGTWAFQKHTELSYYEGEAMVEMKNLDFGAFGSSKVSLGVHCTDCLEGLKYHIYFSFGYENTPPSTPKLIDAQLSSGDNVINFELRSREGTNDVYIYLPFDFKSTDLKYVRFYPADPAPSQWYHLIILWNGKAFTGCNRGEFACIHPLHGGKSQRVRFDKDPNKGYKMVSGFDDKVWTVKDGSSEDFALLVPEKYRGLPQQIWFVEEHNSGYRFHPKHNVTKCIDLSWGHNNNGAKIVSHSCMEKNYAQTFNIVKACSGL